VRKGRFKKGGIERRILEAIRQQCVIAGGLEYNLKAAREQSEEAIRHCKKPATVPLTGTLLEAAGALCVEAGFTDPAFNSERLRGGPPLPNKKS